MINNRTNKSIKNIVWGWGGLFLNLVVAFIARSIFIKMLGAECNGINALFCNIIHTLSMAELGLASAIAYALYGPINNNDEKTTGIIMNFLNKVYAIIAVVVGVVGLSILPFLQVLIKEPIENLSFTINELRGFYLLFIANTSISYLFANKRTIITADQKAYVVSNIDYGVNIVLSVMQIIVLLFTKSYLAFLGIMICKTLITNIIGNLYANVKYPFLKIYRKEKIVKEITKPIMHNISSMMLHRVGTVVGNVAILIIISSVISVVSAGIYGNYIMIVTNITLFINLFYNSVTASIGNLCANEKEDVQYEIFKKMDYVGCFFGFICFICYIVLFNDFIILWVGQEQLFSEKIVLAIALSSFISCLRKGVLTFKDAKGMFRQDRYKPIIEAALGIGLSILLSYLLGVFGAIIGYVIAIVVVSIPYETYVLFNLGFKKSSLLQMGRMLIFTIISFIVAIAVYFLLGLVQVPGIGGFVLKTFLCLIISVVVFLIATCWTREFKYFVALAKKRISRESK